MALITLIKEVYMPATNSAQRRLYTIKQLVGIYPALTESGLRSAIFYNQNNFVNQCVIRVGRKVIIDADALDEWLDGFRGVSS